MFRGAQELQEGLPRQGRSRGFGRLPQLGTAARTLVVGVMGVQTGVTDRVLSGFEYVIEEPADELLAAQAQRLVTAVAMVGVPNATWRSPASSRM